jgi:hypothetical protein
MSFWTYTRMTRRGHPTSHQDHGSHIGSVLQAATRPYVRQAPPG